MITCLSVFACLINCLAGCRSVGCALVWVWACLFECLMVGGLCVCAGLRICLRVRFFVWPLDDWLFGCVFARLLVFVCLSDCVFGCSLLG